MTRFTNNPAVRTTVTISCVLLLPFANSLALGQSFPQNYSGLAAAQTVRQQLLDPEQLDNLVAPIALYPDPLLSQVLVACTYPLEIIEAQQWLQQNRNLQGQRLIEAAKQQNWDPSVQVLVAFPDVVALFSRDIRWTTDLGNALLAQQADVMNAIQRLRAEANNNGRLATTPQQIVTTETQNQQSAIQIQPANPQVIYPPVYDPNYVWGPPASGAYPALSYPGGDYRSGFGNWSGLGNGSGFGGGSGFWNGSGFGNAVNLAGLFSGLLGSGGWGWALNWFAHTLSLSSLFFNSFGFDNSGGGFNSAGGYGARSSVWAHNPAHRRGVPYPNGFLESRYHGQNPGARFSSQRASASSFAPAGFAASRFAASGSFASSRFASGRSPSDGWHFPGGEQAFAHSPLAESRGFERGNRMEEAYDRAGAATYRSGVASNFSSNRGGLPQNYRSYSSATPQRFGSSFQGAAPSVRSSALASHYSEPRTSSQHFSSPAAPSRQSFSAPRMSSSHSSSSHFSAPHFSAPRGSSHSSAPRHSGGGHSGGGHSGKGSHKH